MSCAAVALVSPCRGCKLFDRHEIKAIGGIEMKLADLVADTITGHIRHNVIEDAGELAGEGFVYCCNAVAHHHSCLPYRGTGTKGEGSIEVIYQQFGILDGEAKFVFPHVRCKLFFGDRHTVVAVVFFVGLEGDFRIGMQELDFYFYHIVFFRCSGYSGRSGFFLDKLVFLHKGDVLVGGIVGDEMGGDLQLLVGQGYGVEDYGTVFEDVLYHIQTRFVYYFRLDKFPSGGEDDGMQHVGFYEGGILLAECAIPRCVSREDIPQGFEFFEFFHCCFVFKFRYSF